jgi:hypothetical protein
MEREIKNIVDRILSEEIKKSSNRIKNRINENAGMCSECGGKMYEGECMECGSMYEGEIQELGGMDDGHPRFGKKRFKSPMSIEDIERLLRGDDEDMDTEKFEPLDDVDMDLDKLKPRRDRDMSIDFEEIDEDECMECGDMYEDELEEKLYGNQHKLDKNKNGRLDKEDFAMLRKSKNETELDERLYGNQRRIDKNKNNKIDAEDFAMLRRGNKSKVEETYYTIDNQDGTIFTENEMIDIIEKIINENQKYEKGKVSTSNVLKSSLNKSGKEESDYIDMVTKKMKEYLKDGSKGKYEMNPKHFPVGNGELEEMEKMAFSLTDDNEDFNYQIAGLNIPVPDAIEFNDDRMDKYYEGSSETGNAPGGNALESKANSRFNKFRKNQTLDKLKKQSYNKSPQPVFNEKSGQEKGEGIKIKLESTEDKKVLSEITKMKNLIGYNQKTQ